MNNWKTEQKLIKLKQKIKRKKSTKAKAGSLTISIKLIFFSQENSEKKEETQITNIRNERRDITNDLINVKNIIQEYRTTLCPQMW